MFPSRLLASSLVILLASCTDAGLQPLADDSIIYVDDKLAIEGKFCTSPAEEVDFPVKILLIMDESYSFQCTDPERNRFDALDAAGAHLDGLPNVQFGIVGFSNSVSITPFTNDWASISAELRGVSLGPATDYQGALATTLRVLEQDMVAAGPSMRARTKYVLLFISDGMPEPKCHAGCDDDDLHGCNGGEIQEGYYVDFQGHCPDYNQPYQILSRLRDVMALADFYSVGEMSMHTMFLFSPREEMAGISLCLPFLDQFQYEREVGEELLRAMALEGGGTFRDINLSEEIDFLFFDYEALSASYELLDLFAINRNAIAVSGGYLTDSDMDGLPDELEFELGLDRLSPDSDNDYFSDFLEVQYRHHGFDPLDPEVPAIGCVDPSDRDNDGLRACEELFLRTDPTSADSDGDRIRDGIELLLGTDPRVHDTMMDHDLDGLLSGFESKTGTSPVLHDGDDVFLRQIRYSIVPGPLGENEVRCFDFRIGGLTLVPTLSQPWETSRRGTNRILIHAQEAPGSIGGDRGISYIACVEVRYLGETFKDPISGEILGLHPSRFVQAEIFDPEEHCLAPGQDPSTPLDVE